MQNQRVLRAFCGGTTTARGSDGGRRSDANPASSTTTAKSTGIASSRIGNQGPVITRARHVATAVPHADRLTSGKQGWNGVRGLHSVQGSNGYIGAVLP